MRKIKLKDYENISYYVCAVSRFKDVKYIPSDMVEDVKEYKEMGYTIYGTIPEEVFDKTFIERDIQSTFETQAEDEGYEDMNDFIDYDGEEFKKVKDAVREFIKSLGSTNLRYCCDENTIIEVE